MKIEQIPFDSNLPMFSESQDNFESQPDIPDVLLSKGAVGRVRLCSCGVR